VLNVPVAFIQEAQRSVGIALAGAIVPFRSSGSTMSSSGSAPEFLRHLDSAYDVPIEFGKVFRRYPVLGMDGATDFLDLVAA
jgi:hypothetical protein